MTAPSAPVQRVLDKLKGVKQQGSRWIALCPGHDDNNPSLSIKQGTDGRVLLKCYAGTGCSLDQICLALGIKKADLFTPKAQKANGKKKIVAVYSYVDEQGQLLYQAVRTEPKGFFQRVPNGKGGWNYKLDGVRRVPYKLPELHASKQGATVFIAEGEKDVERLCFLGLIATCNVGGAGKWLDEYSAFMNDRHVIILPDNDEPGRKHVLQVARSLHGKAASIKIVNLPDLPPKGDVSDWLDAGGTSEMLAELVDKSSPYGPANDTEQGPEAQRADHTPLSDGAILLQDDHPDTIAGAFERWSIETCSVRHHFNPMDGWTICKDGKYQTVDAGMQVQKYLSDFLRNAYVPGKGKDPIPTRYKITSTNLANVMQQLSYRDEVYLRPKQAAPCSLRGSLDPQNIIAFNNCLLDISQNPYKEIPLTEDFYTLNYLEYDWEGMKESDKWFNFILEVCNNDTELVTLLAQWCGYLLMPGQPFQKFLLCYGEGANGKGVFFDVVQSVIGDHNCSNVSLSNFNRGPALASTYGKMVNMSDESPKNIEDGVEVLVKQYTGGTKIQFEKKYKDPVEAYPTAKLMFSCNELPRFRDASNGVWRRILLAPFKASFIGKENFTLAEDLKREKAAIICFFLEGLQSLRKMGRFIEPEICQGELEQFRKDCNPEMVFLMENFEARGEDVPSVKCTDVRTLYVRWCEVNGHRPKSASNFGKTVSRLFPSIIRQREREGNKLSYFYHGLSLKAESELNVGLL